MVQPEHPVHKAVREGREAYRRGEPETSNPYGTAQLRKVWIRGYTGVEVEGEE